MTVTKERTPDTVELTPGYIKLVEKLKFYQQLNTAVFEIADFLLGEYATEHEWLLVAKHYQWHTMDREVLRELARKIHDHQHGHPIMHPIIHVRAPHLEDYYKIGETIYHPHVRWAAYHHVWEAGKQFNRLDYAREIINKMYPPVDYRDKNVEPNNDFGNMTMSQYYTWYKIMYAV
jgi:hypothetical protein